MIAYRQPALSVERQYGLLRMRHPDGAGSCSRKGLVWRCSFQPTAVSRTYRVRVTYELGRSPQVLVEEPDLKVLAGGKRIEHLYSQETLELCLWLPAAGEWNSRMPIAETVMPWTALWLYYFEDWLATGTWRGGGVHPESGTKREAAPTAG